MRRYGGPRSTLLLGLGLGILMTVGTLGPSTGLGQPAPSLTFGAAQRLGQLDKNASTPFLRYRSDGRLFAVWTEDDRTPEALARPPAPKHSPEHAWMYSTTMRELLVASSPDGGSTWTSPRRVNSAVESIQGEENTPRVAFGADNRAYVIWSIPGDKGNKARANVRFAMEDGQGGFTPSRTLNDVADTARFPTLEPASDGTLLVAWIDRRLDSPAPRQLYLMRLEPAGPAAATPYKVGAGLCECCRRHRVRRRGPDRLHGGPRASRRQHAEPRPAEVHRRRPDLRSARRDPR
jgi:hypothetical protein